MKLPFALCSIAVISLSSCITTLHPLVSENNIITDNRIVGIWADTGYQSRSVQKFIDSKFTYIFSEGKDKYSEKDSIFFIMHYVISWRENDLEYTFFGGLVKIKGQYYISLTSEECLNNLKKDVFELGKNSSSIARLEWKDKNTVVLKFLNGDKIKKIILSGKALIKYEYDPLYETFLITASSEELEQFLEKYGNNEVLYEGGNILKLTRKT